MGSINKTNKIFKIEFTGGEPFLIPNIIEACEELTKKHYIEIISNFTSDRITEFCRVRSPESA